MRIVDPGTDRDLATVGAELDGVVDQVHDDLTEPGRVTADRREAGRRVELERDALPLPEEPQPLRGIGRQATHIDAVGQQERATTFDPAQVQELVDHLDEVTRLDLDLGDPVAQPRARVSPPGG
jgi:hypothetical protein